ncbi:hypothetical protein [Rhodopirellula sp. P2]|uniref:hypothetical protein n=1 Tax=Rhodopirellula sp. P2 TaxID=2127060 RepID=UPI0023677AE1|nr:hypothetical protein [Rhodopirellula sp. P2]WDQ17418.1 hypothetical protein PSR62_02420 [Rhodopirellula sp. P2]
MTIPLVIEARVSSHAFGHSNVRETLAILAVPNNTEIAAANFVCHRFDIDRSPAGLLMRSDLFRLNAFAWSDLRRVHTHRAGVAPEYSSIIESSK